MAQPICPAEVKQSGKSCRFPQTSEHRERAPRGHREQIGQVSAEEGTSES